MTDTDDLSTTGADPTSELIVAFVQKAQALFLAGGVEVTLRAVLDLAVGTIEGCDSAGIFVLEEGGRVTTSVRTDPLVADVEDRQLAANMGPCLDVIAEAVPVYAEDLAVDPRWPDFGPGAAARGVRSVLALRLAADGTLGALNLYARYPAAFGAVDRAKGVVLAGLAGVALSLAQARDQDVRQAENLRHALVTRELVGQAQGILMEREHITADQAFGILRRASQNLNVKLREVAQDLVDTGERPETGSTPQPL
ncbi:MAG TPA: GAF and ANTAR domain-containing protein [Acidimicrobiales bacterium]|nr:GAF and ANTAR domain-containing protein [Acidimicrobiales bacterium]